MDILIVSDTHGRRDRLAELLRRTRAGILLFLGDGLRDLEVVDDGIVVRAVRGNCDFTGRDVPESSVENFGTCRVFMTHGHRFGVKSSVESAAIAAAQAGADILLYGHTHQPLHRTLPEGTALGGCTLEKPLQIFCPGSLGEPRCGEPSFGMLTLRHGAWLLSHGEF
jgi:putative phosphoesterase